VIPVPGENSMGIDPEPEGGLQQLYLIFMWTCYTDAPKNGESKQISRFGNHVARDIRIVNF
jgi:hypothetical protein